MKTVIVLVGKPGAGKGTLLSQFMQGREDRYEVISVGNLLRKAMKEQTELGKSATAYVNAGGLVPDEIVNAIVNDGIKKSEKTVILDGCPRTVRQANLLLEAGIYPDKVINIYVDDETVIKRAKDRVVCENCGEAYTTNEFKRPKIKDICDKCGGILVRRKDDEEEIVRHRLAVYREQTEPVLEAFINNVIKIFTIDNTCDNAFELFERIM